MKINLFKSAKISWKLTILYSSIFSLILILLNASVLYGIKFFLIQQTEQRVEGVSAIIEDKIKGSIGERMALSDPELLGEAQSDATINVNVANTEGSIVNKSINFKMTPMTLSASPNVIKKIETNEEHLLVLNKKVMYDGKLLAYLQVVGNMEKEYWVLKVLFILMAAADLAGVVISLLAGYTVSRRMLYPIDRITKAAQSISINNLDRKIEVGQTDDELSRLAGTFNEMIDRLRISFEKQNQFVSDASHELRTPISVIQGYINLIDRWGKEDRNVLQESIDAIKNEASGMTELIEELLFLARGDSENQRLKKVQFNLNDLVEEVVKESRLISKDRNLNFSITQTILILADRKMIKRMLRALIDNSIKFTPPDGNITVKACEDKNIISIVIKDTGIGIPEEEVENIFNRFYRVDKARTKETGGSGLGLSIVKWIVDAHGGSIKAESVLGKGTEITITLPQD